MEIRRKPGLQIYQVIFDTLIKSCVACVYTHFLHKAFKREKKFKLLPYNFLTHSPNFPINVFTLLATTMILYIVSLHPWVQRFELLKNITQICWLRNTTFIAKCSEWTSFSFSKNMLLLLASCTSCKQEQTFFFLTANENYSKIRLTSRCTVPYSVHIASGVMI
jgi:hypothetical protein